MPLALAQHTFCEVINARAQVGYILKGVQIVLNDNHLHQKYIRTIEGLSLISNFSRNQ
jgi:hypothetical protein